MLRKIKITLFISLFFIISCSGARIESEKKWMEIHASQEFRKEKVLFRNRMDGKIFCNIGISDFILSPGLSPSRECMYLTSPLVLDRGSIFVKPSLQQHINSLRIIQTTEDGFLINTRYWSVGYGHRMSLLETDQIIFIHKTDEPDLIDNSYLDASYPYYDNSSANLDNYTMSISYKNHNNYNWTLYEYAGIYHYKTAGGGSKTMHSFRRISNKKIITAKSGLKFYDPFREFLLENKLWDLFFSTHNHEPR